MKKFILTAFTVLTYSFNASAVLIQPARSNEVDEFVLSLEIASRSQKNKKAWAKMKASQRKSALALKSPAAQPTLDTDTQKREIASFERKLKETATEVQAATGSNNNTISAAQENSEQQFNHENSITAPQNEVIDSNPPLEQASIEPPVVVNEHANEHANNNAQNNSSTESSSQNNSSNGSENSNAGGKKK